MRKTATITTSTTPEREEEMKWWKAFRKELNRQFGDSAEHVMGQRHKSWYQQRRQLGWKPKRVVELMKLMLIAQHSIR